MKEIDDKMVDMILCDLPYGITACKWDKVLPLDELWKQYKRIIKKNGVVVLTASQPFTTDLINSNRKWFKYNWVWVKNTGTGIVSAKYQPMRYSEDILIFGNGKNTFNPEMIKRTEGSKKRLKYKLITGGYSEHINVKKNKIKRNPDEKYPSNILFINTKPNSIGKLHPTEKPIELFRYLIKTYTQEGELVLDNCIGSGTTAVACKQTNRNFIGFEINKEYVKIANKRLNENGGLKITQKLLS